ncbi:MAG: IS1634 family transposase, partial [Coleofasciculus sp. G1-WW12-02]|uniref:IS1634 family transposase n=1 Tax=Coleofasciculus sp. G1-WW12-02 TaxID=3068483 RepID=UPI0033019FBF
KKVRKRTLANLSKLPDEAVDGLKILLKGGKAIEDIEEAFNIVRSRPHGHVAAVLGTIKKIGLDSIISSENTRNRRLVLSMIAARIIAPKSKLATARGLQEATKLSSLGELLGLSGTDEDELYLAMDWLLSRQEEIENSLAAIHLVEGTLVLYDVSSTYFEGKTCPLAQFGYNRDKKKGKLQIVFGLLCNAQGCPISVEVFEGNTADPSTLTQQIEKVRTRFGLKKIIWVGDRGMITQARIREDLYETAGVDWITALRSSQIRKLVNQSYIQLSLFDEKDLAEITCEDYPGERLVACRNPLLAEVRKRNREELLQATEQKLDKIVSATSRQRCPLRGEAEIGLKVGEVINKYGVAKHFQIQITPDSFTYQRNRESINEEATLDGLYVVRTSVPEETLTAEDTVKAYKSLSKVEQAFRSYKTIDLKVRPIYHPKSDRVKAHVFLCMLAYYVEWHMRRCLAPLLFDEDDWENALRLREGIVTHSVRSDSASSKAQKKRTVDNLPVHSFQTLLADLGTIVNNRIQSNIPSVNFDFDKVTEPTPVQRKALDLLGVSLICTQ